MPIYENKLVNSILGRKMNRKLLETGLAITALSLLLVGCGSNDNTTAASPTGSTDNTTSSSSSGFTKTTNTFTLNDSNLTWQDNAEIYTLGADSNTEANQICESRTIDGFSDWRLPTESEVFALYSTNRENLSYTYENYKNETYFDDLKLRHLTWTSYYRQSNYTSNKFGVINEILATQSNATVYSSMFLPAEGSQSGKNYSIRCVRNHL